MRRCLLALLIFATSVSAQDIRIIIDISGSMADNDPNNLRRPALELLIESLPTGSTAGVWTFGQYVNMLVPHDTVNRQWRRAARARVGEIVSIAQRTNIGDAITTAAYDMDTSGDAEPVTYLLLTDGFVDVSPERARNFAERNRILQTILPSLRDGNATLHTIALSDAADNQLLDFLALRTGGVSTLVTSADDLPRVFADLLGVSVASEQIPLSDTQSFMVDETVSEVTALMFISPGGSLMLQSPAGELIDQATQRTDVRWFRDQRYALVTIVEPIAGEWKVEGPLAPGSRVNVIANLSLQVTPPVTNAVIGESLLLQATMMAEQAIPEQILAQTTVSASLSEPGQMPVWQVELNQQGENFTGVIDALPGGSWRLDVTAESGTFSRRRSYLVTVRSPFSVEVLNEQAAFTAVLRANSEQLTVTQALAELSNGDVVALAGEMSQWQASIAGADSVQIVVTYEQDGVLQQWRSSEFLLKGGDQMMMAASKPAAVPPTPIATPTSTPMPTLLATSLSTPMPVASSTPTPVVEQMTEDMVELPVTPQPTVDMWAQAEEEQGSNWLAYVIAGVLGVSVLGVAFYLFKRYEARIQTDTEDENSIELAQDNDEQVPAASIDITLDDIDLDESFSEDSNPSSASQSNQPAELSSGDEDLPDDLDSLQDELDKLSGEIGDPNDDIDDVLSGSSSDDLADLGEDDFAEPADQDALPDNDLASLDELSGEDDFDAQLPSDDDFDAQLPDDSDFDMDLDEPNNDK